MTKGELLKELEGLDDDAVIYVTGCTETNEYFHIRGVTDKVTGADVQNEVTLVCEKKKKK